MGGIIKILLKNSGFLFSLVVLLSSCAFQRSNNDTSNAQQQANLHAGNGEGFNGGNGEGFNGIINPSVSYVYTPSKKDLERGTVLTLIGSNFEYGVIVKLGEVDCDAIVLSKTKLTCTLSENLASITTVSIQNPNSKLVVISNPEVLSDSDGDGISDDYDNCEDVWNPDQKKSSGNWIIKGDACNPDLIDYDKDGTNDGADNCPNDYNPGQEDLDKNDIGDSCEPSDRDNDGILNHLDNCPNDYNPGQEVIDNSWVGIACTVYF